MATSTTIKEIKKLDNAGLQFLASEEGTKLVPYLDSVGIPTIGVGCTFYENGKRVKITDPPITMARALQLFKNVVHLFEVTVWSVTRDDINQHQFNALVSICFNIGITGFKKSTLLRLVNENPQHCDITAAFEMWKNAGGRPVLLERRKREASLYFLKSKI